MASSRWPSSSPSCRTSLLTWYSGRPGLSAPCWFGAIQPTRDSPSRSSFMGFHAPYASVSLSLAPSLTHTEKVHKHTLSPLLSLSRARDDACPTGPVVGWRRLCRLELARPAYAYEGDGCTVYTTPTHSTPSACNSTARPAATTAHGAAMCISRRYQSLLFPLAAPRHSTFHGLDGTLLHHHSLP